MDANIREARSHIFHAQLTCFMALARRFPCIVHKQVTVSSTTTCDLTLQSMKRIVTLFLPLYTVVVPWTTTCDLSWKVQENLKMFLSKFARYSKSNEISSHLLSYELSNILPYPEISCFRFQSPIQAFRDTLGKLIFSSTFSRLQPYPILTFIIMFITSESF